MLAERVFVDVDVGTDDAMALLLLLFAETLGMVTLDGISCVNGNTKVDNVVTNVVRILEVAGRTDIPVYKGSNYSLIPSKIGSDEYFGLDGFGDVEWETTPDISILNPQVAAVALGEIVTRNPGQINVIALGPLTNIALAIRMYPTFVTDVKSIHVMGGNYGAVGNMSPAAEFNFFVDPEAAFIVLEASKTLVQITTWESILKNNITTDWRFNVLGTIPGNPVLEIINRAELNIFTDQIMYHPADAYTIAAFLYPDETIKEAAAYSATVELHGSETRGQVVLNHLDNSTQNAFMIKSTDEEFLKSLFIAAANSSLIKHKIAK